MLLVNRLFFFLFRCSISLQCRLLSGTVGSNRLVAPCLVSMKDEQQPLVAPGAQAGSTEPVNYLEKPGLQWLGDVSGVFVQQRVELLEAVTGCETPNRYNIFPIKNGVPEPLETKWLEHFRENASPLLKGKERSDCLTLICCPRNRDLKMSFTDPTTEPDHPDHERFLIDRPYRCTLFCPGVCMHNPQELSLWSASSGGVATQIAHAKEKFRCMWCCTRTFEAQDDNQHTIYILRASECGHSQGNNCGAPSCCCPVYSIDIFDPSETNIIANARWVWPGWSCAGFTDRSNAEVRFEAGSTTTERAALLNAIFLIEYSLMEWKRLDAREGSQNQQTTDFAFNQ